MISLRCCSWSLLALLAGCGEPPPRLYPIQGSLTLRNQPLPNAELTFHPQFDGPGWMPVAVVDAEGRFAAGTLQPGDGGLPGTYKVTVVWKPNANEDGEGPNEAPRRYTDLQTTPLLIEIGPEHTSPAQFELVP